LRFNEHPQPDQLVLAVEDLDEPDGKTRVATADDVAMIIEFGRRHADGNLLIHCNAGVARSTAAALAIIADRRGPGCEAEALAEMLRLRPCAVPNLLIVRFADELLGRGGRLLEAVQAWDLQSEWCRWRRKANAAAARGEPILLWPKGLKVPGDGDDVGILIETRMP